MKNRVKNEWMCASCGTRFTEGGDSRNADVKNWALGLSLCPSCVRTRKPGQSFAEWLDERWEEQKQRIWPA